MAQVSNKEVHEEEEKEEEAEETTAPNSPKPSGETIQTSLDRGSRWLGIIIGMLQGFLAFVPEALRTRTFMWILIAAILSILFGPSDFMRELLGSETKNSTTTTIVS